jgi:hypothetical protein
MGADPWAWIGGRGEGKSEARPTTRPDSTLRSHKCFNTVGRERKYQSPGSAGGARLSAGG